MTFFDAAFAIVVGIEAGYVNDPQDPGGETMHGVSKRSYPTEDIPNVTLDRARFLFKRDKWDPHKCDELEWGKALCVFNAAVMGGNVTRWVSMYGGEPLERFVEDFQAEYMLYLASLKNWLHDGRGWARREFKIARLALRAAA
jgi:lysozyme family protein